MQDSIEYPFFRHGSIYSHAHSQVSCPMENHTKNVHVVTGAHSLTPSLSHFAACNWLCN